MKPADCPRYAKCSAPICPLEVGPALGQSSWYPHEDICARNGAPKFVRKQRRIKKVTGGDQDRGYFTLGMLQKVRVSKKIAGRDPDREQKPKFGAFSPLGVCFQHLSPPPPTPDTPPKRKKGGMNDGLRRYIEERRRKKGVKDEIPDNPF